MGYYNKATICKNGHATSSVEAVSDNYCSICGAENISKCTNCGADIRGRYKTPGVVIVGETYIPPKYCYNCSKPFPWTEQAISALQELIFEDAQLSQSESELLSDSLSDVISETPRTSLAATRIQKALQCLGSVTAETLRQFVIDFGCELIKKTLNL